MIEQFKAQLQAGDLSPGDRLPPERELAASLGVSRGSIRQALGALELLGVIESRVGDGTFIVNRRVEILLEKLSGVLGAGGGADRSLVHVGVMDIFEPRLILEPDVAARAAERATAEDLEALGGVIEAAGEKVDRGEIPDEEDLEFHIAIASCTHNPVTVWIIKDLMELNRAHLWKAYKGAILAKPGRLRSHYQEHLRIYEAIVHGDSFASREAMRQHLEHSGREFAQIITAETG